MNTKRFKLRIVTLSVVAIAFSCFILLPSVQAATYSDNTYGTAKLDVEVEAVRTIFGHLRQQDLSIAIAADTKGSYKVVFTEIVVEMKPIVGAGWWLDPYRTTQVNGDLNTVHIAEGNDLNKRIHPADAAAETQAGCQLLSETLGIVTGLALSPLSVGTGLVVGVIVDGVMQTFFDYIGESRNVWDPDANGGTDYSTKVRWDYGWSSVTGIKPSVTVAGGVSEMQWTCESGYTSYYITITAKVGWGKVSVQYRPNTADVWYLEHIATTTLTKNIYYQ
ncbi:MAG: hypothetical protein ACFFED_01615 [Candidatus Thorarchaeota archaeon]